MENTKNLLTNQKKATIEMLLLKLLSESDMYGYQIVQEFKKRSQGIYTILEGSMYPILYRLTERNFITSYEKKAGPRQKRVYYHLEPDGHAYYLELVQAYHAFLDVIQFLLDSKEGDLYHDA